MDLQEVLRKQKARGFKKTQLISLTMTVDDYLSNPNARRPYIDEENTSVPLAIVKKEELIETSESPKITENECVAIVADVATVAESENKLSIVKSNAVISDTTATQEVRSATQKVSMSDTIKTQGELSATQKVSISDTIKTQEVRSATQTATQNVSKNNQNMGRPKKIVLSYSSLVGNELKIVNEVYSECVKSQSLETGFIEKNSFSQRVKVKAGAIRTSCARLRAKNVLDDFIATKGRGSSWKFALSESIYQQISLIFSMKNASISDTNSDTITPSSRSSNINNKTTTTQLPDDWKKITYQELQKALAVYNEVFGITQLKSIYIASGQTMSASDVQSSINNFTESLNNYIKKPSGGVHARKTKIATLLEHLKNGEMFVDPCVEAAREAEAKKITTEQRKETAARYFESKFENYFASLTEEQAISLIPDAWKNGNATWDHIVKTDNKQLQLSYAKERAKIHFEKNIWPDVLERLLNA